MIVVFLCAIIKWLYNETWIYFQINTVFSQRDIALKHILFSKNIHFSVCYSQRHLHWNSYLFWKNTLFFQRDFALQNKFIFHKIEDFCDHSQSILKNINKINFLKHALPNNVKVKMVFQKCKKYQNPFGRCHKKK